MQVFLLVKFGCPFCRKAMKAVQRVNMNLPIEKKVQVIDGHYWEEHGIELNPLLPKFGKIGFNAYPFMYVMDEETEDGIVIEITHPKFLNRYLTELLSEDLIN